MEFYLHLFETLLLLYYPLQNIYLFLIQSHVLLSLNLIKPYLNTLFVNNFFIPNESSVMLLLSI